MAKPQTFIVRMKSPDGFTSFSADEVQYDASKDGVFEISSDHVPAAEAHGLVQLKEKK